MNIPAFAAPTTTLLLLALVTPLTVTAQSNDGKNAPSGQLDAYQRGVRDGIQLWGMQSQARRHRGRSGEIRIGSAIYGSQFGTCDFAQQLAALADGQRTYRFSVGNDWCGDPSPGNFKNARVRYSCGRHQSRVVEARSGQSVMLSCD
ncbi:hypothetical protein [uncultured Thiodictyon sp.]|uniref:hypothetical protein n=1 Tax=uncultured Thiodictyon sp. TaxID=1846217 RepID=UPI0025FCF0F0|nr:hypothetical protein [uncultured Thiodictyon sp.]